MGAQILSRILVPDFLPRRIMQSEIDVALVTG
jgi:hypothetical protein